METTKPYFGLSALHSLKLRSFVYLFFDCSEQLDAVCFMDVSTTVCWWGDSYDNGSVAETVVAIYQLQLTLAGQVWGVCE